MEANEIPESVSLRSFLTARTQELISLSQRISGKSSQSSGSSVPFKHIPKNLRRRAVSHNVKRLPFHFRPKVDQKASNGAKGDPLSFISSKKLNKKSGSRKQRRRHGTLLLEFNRRQRQFKWLETHIWHAKRFHIEAKWNHKIPIAPCDKGQRALYRSTKNYVTMQDISFYSCYQLQGDFEALCSGFQSIAPRNANQLSIGAVMYKSGDREGHLFLYKKDSYPGGYIGDIRFHWLRTKTEICSVLQFWVHPAFTDEVLQEILNVFSLNDTPEVSLEEASSEQSIDQVKLQPKNLNQKPIWTNQDNSVTLIDCSGTLNRVRFCGPEIIRVLKEVLCPTPAHLIESSKSWLRWFNDRCCEGLAGREYLEAQGLLWETMENVEDFPSQIILPLTVRDPRVFLPQKRAKVLLNNEETDDDEVGEEEQMEVDDKIEGAEGQDQKDLNVLEQFMKKAVNPLEDPEVLRRVLLEKMADHEFCKRRAGLLIPGSQIDLGPQENQIPVVLIHRPRSANAKHFSDGGFDLLIPAGWMMAFWISFAYRAVRVTGLRDSISCAFETANLHSSYFPQPDSESGRSKELQSSQQSQISFFKLPPAKRCNLIKLACACPFKQDWTSLLSLWSNSPITSYFVLRDIQKLSYISKNIKSKFWKKLAENLSSVPNLENCLIGVRVEILGHGTAEKGAVISMPADSDQLPAPNHSVNQAPVNDEIPWDDRDQKKLRDELHTKHQKNMSFLRRKRKKIRQAHKGEEEPDLSSVGHYDSSDLSRLYNERINKLWLLPDSEVVTNLAKLSRKPVGFVVYGGNEYSRGKCTALGYVCGKALLEFAQNREASKKLKNFLLLRNWNNSFVHRAVRFEVLKI